MKHATKQDLSYTLLSVHSEIESNWVHISSINNNNNIAFCPKQVGVG
jgi:hypothetical protein